MKEFNKWFTISFSFMGKDFERTISIKNITIDGDTWYYYFDINVSGDTYTAEVYGTYDDDGNIRNAARLQPVDGRQARGSNDLVDNAVVVVVHDAPQNADDRAGQQRREEPQRAHQPAGQTVSAALIERERCQERDDDGDRGHADGEGHGGEHHFAEALDLMQVHVVVQADEVVGLGKSVPVGETVADDIDQGNDHKDRAEHQRRQDKEDAGGPLIALKLREPSSAGRTFHRIPLFSGLRWVTRMG